MSNEIEYAYATGKSLYALIMNASGQVWNTSTAAFVSPSTGSWTSYPVAVNEQSSTGLFTGSFPTGITSPGTYTVMVYAQAGGSAASTDTPIATGAIDWSGTAEMTLADVHFRRLLRYVDGNYSYNPSTHVLTLYDLNGSTVVMTATLTIDGSGNITGRTIS